MAFVVEDGTGLSTSNSYVSVAEFKSHHTDRGRDISSIADADIETSCVRASDYLDKRFGRRFIGVRQSKSQAMEWPRLDAFDQDDFLLNGVDDVPRQLKKACSEYALRAYNYGELSPDVPPGIPRQSLATGSSVQESSSVSGQIKRKSEKVDVIEESTTYLTAAELAAQKGSRSSQSSLVNDFNIPEYPEADLWIEELLKSSFITRVERGS